ncbi:MAG: M20/M25/M40 family metallo-hydrolase [Bryobacterales bacterium]|nr:M20/M25/M40 family metallo-hydrolase [Bryobacterales bacterium]
MDVFALTRTLVDIESITGNEKAVGDWLFDYLEPLAAEYGGTLERIEVEPNRFNLLAIWGDPVVTMSTHLDTVPPFFASREDEEFIWGRGACDVKGIIACMIHAAKALLAEGRRGFALLFVVGEERNSAGAYFMANKPRGSRYLINGEPTSCKLALGSKGALRYELVASGRMAHSAYPELGESAIEKLLDALERVRRIDWPVHPVLGPSTLNIGTIAGGRAPNVVPDEARAELLIRLVDDPAPVRAAVLAACEGLVEAKEQLCIPAILMDARPGFETDVMKYTTDIPAFGGAWGKPLLLGPGTIHVAHTSQERVPKAELLKATGLYAQLVRQLLEEGKSEA